MGRKKRINNSLLAIFVVIILAITIASFWYNPLGLVNVPYTALDQKVEPVVLENGLTVTVKEIPSIPLVTIQFWVHAGGKDEPLEYKGIAHIFEHIWFKGTATQPVGSFHKKVESLGGDLNAMTSLDWTTYFVTVPADKFEEIFPYMTDLLFNPLFDETEIQKEKEVIFEEQRLVDSNPEQYLDEKFTSLLVDEHPYKHPIIGYKETIEAAANKEPLQEFYNTWYVPNNMNIIIAGNINKEETIAKVQDAFKDFKPKELPKQIRPVQLPNTTPKYATSKKNVGNTYIAIGYTMPEASHKDKYAAILLNTIFSEGESSRLQKEIKKEKHLIVSGKSNYYALNELGAFETIIIVEPEKTSAAKAEVLLQLERFKTETVGEEELKKAKTIIKAERLKSHEEVFQIGFDIGNAWIDGNIHEYSTFIENINKVTAKDIQRVANNYFKGYTLYEVKPKI
ncbi:hypothetical protein COV18_06745 [Candidatus Woesearchaeota archaeon CG10_big_fil_rev_8_21_14_0_10_37_12]|nr:MAG: hypothetical protein COV18_06745 [Candidatus Woesearchaeota archaeon CG10_big_fil_rev_8_21_14_0_10_37_12]